MPALSGAGFPALAPLLGLEMTRPRGRQWVGVAYSLSYLTEEDTEEEGKDGEEEEKKEEKEEKPLAEPLEVQVRAESAVGGTRSPDMTTGPDPARGVMVVL